ncbi:hypothetical protein NDN08_003828 [Rhodosorus marinus]|uniref:Mitochondrial carrier protein n=2 Tax=Rhodosorus marinus TaxID=101924 RepID=A0AAV8UGJ3_9RHOD|nr:hypothetical protein NDN08_003828 [Rhodosorus marinus]
MATATNRKEKPKPKQAYSFIAGGLAGSFAATITCPLEVLKTKLQSSMTHNVVVASTEAGKNATKRSVWDSYKVLIVAKQIAVQEGPVGFFRGLLPTVLGIFPTRATYFWAYSTVKSKMEPVLGNSPGTHIISAASAGIGSAVATNPVWMIKTRYQLAAGTPNPYRSYSEVISVIWNNEGVGGFYKGLSASIWGVSETIIQFLIYERVKTEMLERARAIDPEAELKGMQVFSAAAGAKMTASLMTYPHEVVRTRLREKVPEGMQPKYIGMAQSLRVIFMEEGVRGLYSGIEAHMLRTVPNAAFMFLAYESVVKFLTNAEEKIKLRKEEQRIKGNLY